MNARTHARKHRIAHARTPTISIPMRRDTWYHYNNNNKRWGVGVDGGGFGECGGGGGEGMDGWQPSIDFVSNKIFDSSA